MSMKRVTLVKLLVEDEDKALEFYTTRLGFEVVEDDSMGDYRWLLVRLPDNQEFCITGGREERRAESADRSPGCRPAPVQHRNR